LQNIHINFRFIEPDIINSIGRGTLRVFQSANVLLIRSERTISVYGKHKESPEELLITWICSGLR